MTLLAMTDNSRELVIVPYLIFFFKYLSVMCCLNTKLVFDTSSRRNILKGINHSTALIHQYILLTMELSLMSVPRDKDVFIYFQIAERDTQLKLGNWV